MKKGIRILALALVFAVLLPTSMAMAVTEVNISRGSVNADANHYTQGQSSPAPHDGAVSIISDPDNHTTPTPSPWRPAAARR